MWHLLLFPSTADMNSKLATSTATKKREKTLVLHYRMSDLNLVMSLYIWKKQPDLPARQRIILIGGEKLSCLVLLPVLMPHHQVEKLTC